MTRRVVVHTYIYAPLLALAVSLAWPLAPARADTRVALVIGNSNYLHAVRLANPANDADQIAAALTRARFAVQKYKDLDSEAMRRAIIAFGTQAANADVAVVYYAGHGIQVSGTNYLIPVDAALESPASLNLEAIAAETVLDAVGQARVLRLVILDACRENPFKNQLAAIGTRGIGDRGLAPTPVSGQGDTLVAYAAKDGTTARDGAGANSPYATALAHRLVEPGTELDKMFREVTSDVLQATGGQQEPFVYASRSNRDFYFMPGGTVINNYYQSAPPAASNAHSPLTGRWGASGGPASTEFGGAPFAVYRTTLSDVRFEVEFTKDGDAIDGMASAVATEAVVAGNIGTIPPNTHKFVFASGNVSKDEITLVFNGEANNRPPTKARFKGKLQSDGARIVGVLTISRNDANIVVPQVLWSIDIPLVLERQ